MLLPVFTSTRTHDSCMCLTLPFVQEKALALFYLSLRNMYLYTITCVQETCLCPPLQVFKKLVGVRQYLCSINLFGPPLPVFSKLERVRYPVFNKLERVRYPVFNKLERLRYYLCKINVYVSSISCVKETCTCPRLPVFKRPVRVRYYLCTRNFNVSAIPCVEKNCTCPSYPVYNNLSVSDNTCVWETHQSAVLGCVIYASDISCTQTFNGI